MSQTKTEIPTASVAAIHSESAYLAQYIITPVDPADANVLSILNCHFCGEKANTRQEGGSFNVACGHVLCPICMDKTHTNCRLCGAVSNNIPRLLKCEMMSVLSPKVPDPIRKAAQTIMVWCNRKCGWKGTVRELCTEHPSHCALELTECWKCEKLLQRKDIASHHCISSASGATATAMKDS